MSIEQKAKAYDKAVEKIKYVIGHGVEPVLNRSDLESIFPELKESEDEKIRNTLIKYFKERDSYRDEDETFAGIPFIDVIAWLEKQKPAAKVESFADEFNTEFQKQVANIIASVLNKEHEYSKGYIEWIAQSLLGYAKNEMKPAEWSEDDDAKWYGVIETEEYMLQVVRGAKKFDVGNKEIERQCEEELDWLKSLRPQKQCGYNPYKAAVESIAEMCKHYDKLSHSALRDFYDNVKVKCKDAKEYDAKYPQKQWKPSDKQMQQLKWVAEQNKDNMLGKELSTLYNDLKQL